MISEMLYIDVKHDPKKRRKKRASSGVIVKVFEKTQKLGIGKELHKGSWSGNREETKKGKINWMIQ